MAKSKSPAIERRLARIPNARDVIFFKRRILSSVSFFGVVLLAFATAFPPLDVAAETNLAIHMGQHALIVVAGILFAYPLYRKQVSQGKILVNRGKFSLVALGSFLLLCVLVVFWHIPLAWDAAVLNPFIHMAEHASFFLIGVIIGWFLPRFPDNFKLLIIFLAVAAHMFYGFSLYLIQTPIYPLYSVAQQQILGVLMFGPSPLYFVGFLVLTLTREAHKLEAMEYPKIENVHGIPVKKGRRSRAGRQIVPLISILLIAVLVGYFAITAGLIFFSSAGSGQAHVATVYIEESPITWQYSPQNLKVVIGVNNTVVWVSHSVSQDTVTSSDSAFNSGVIEPGGTWSFTFSSPGVYHYSCAYHPWMQGTVTVLSS